MPKVKTLLSLFAVVLIILSCNSVLLSSASPLIQKGDVGYTQIADGFLFPTPTPKPTPTPIPTATPVPTPRPEPSAKPTLEMYCRSTASVNALQVDVTGILTYNKTGISDAAIYLGFSVDGGEIWENFELVRTNALGDFGAIWIPNATGNYLLCANWDGNLTLHWINATLNLALTPDSGGNIFSVVSNSTISNLAYDSVTQEISFSTNGTSQTTGYVYACIPKALVRNIQTLQVTMDGAPITFASESQDDVWVISCFYAQSEHTFTIQIPITETLTPDTLPWELIIISSVIIGLIVIIAIAVAIRRRRRTAAIVASILKENKQ